MKNNCILQRLDRDFEDNVSTQAILQLCEQIHLGEFDATYQFWIYLGNVSSESPSLFVVHVRDFGFFLSLTQIVDGKCVNYVAQTDCNSSEEVRVKAGEYELAIPAKHFVEYDSVVDCVSSFCEEGRLHKSVAWIRYDQLDVDFYC